MTMDGSCDCGYCVWKRSNEMNCDQLTDQVVSLQQQLKQQTSVSTVCEAALEKRLARLEAMYLPKFKEGDQVVYKDAKCVYTIQEVRTQSSRDPSYMIGGAWYGEKELNAAPEPKKPLDERLRAYVERYKEVGTRGGWLTDLEKLLDD